MLFLTHVFTASFATADGENKLCQEYALHGREKPRNTSALQNNELLSCSLVAKPLLSSKAAVALRLLKPRSESKEISKSLRQCFSVDIRWSV